MTPGEIRQLHEDMGLVLDCLDSVFPEGLLEDELFDTMLSLPRPVGEANVRRDLGVLADWRLVERFETTHPITRRRQIRWRLTAAGVTFLRHNKPWAKLEGD